MKSLGTRLALVISTVLFVLVMLTGLWLERQLVNIIYQEEVTQAEVHAKTLLASLQTLMLNGQGILARQWLDRMDRQQGIVDIDVLRINGQEAFSDLSTVEDVNRFLKRPRFQRQPAQPRNNPPPPKDLFDRATNGEVVFDQSVQNQITVLMPIHADTACLACHGYDRSALRGILRLSLSREDTAKRVDAMRNQLWAVGGILVLTLGLALWTALRFNVLRPIAVLRQAITRVGQGDRSAKLPVDWRDELGEVAIVFNRMQKNLHATETRIRSVMDNVMDAIITIDEQGVMESVNPAVIKMFGYSPVELIGKNISILMPEPYKSLHDGYIAEYLRSKRAKIIGKGAVEVVAMRKDGTVFPLEIGLSELHIDDRLYFIGIGRDITQRKAQMLAIQHQALHDALTELPNRTLLSDRLQQAVLRTQRSGGQFALLIMDLDRFKEINDTLGHHYGDLMLKQVAKRMQISLRESDSIARLGGDEFAVLLSKSDAEQAAQIAQKLLSVLDAPFALEGQVLHIGASIGISLFPDHGQDPAALMRLADVAMYVAKRAQSGYALYDAAKDEHTLRNLALVGELRAAIEHQQLVVYYQPKLDVKTGKVTGVEALLRWHHPTHGLMQPEEFIELAEQTGLIMSLTMWVIGEGLRQAREWQQAGVDLDMAVNLSVRNLQDAQFLARVTTLVEVLGLRPGSFWLEITETAIMSDTARAQVNLIGLSKLGFKLSIDDFGTGYSSLAYLKQLPVNEVKIDKSFVLGMVDSDSSAAIVHSTIDLAHTIGLHVIAEGVEDEKTYRLLGALGCDAIQGNYISPPLPVADLMAWLQTSPWSSGGQSLARPTENP